MSAAESTTPLFKLRWTKYGDSAAALKLDRVKTVWFNGAVVGARLAMNQLL